jgi:hypothetical protein
MEVALVCDTISKVAPALSGESPGTGSPPTPGAVPCLARSTQVITSRVPL